MRLLFSSAVASFALLACAYDAPYDPLADYEQVDAVTVLDAPTPSGAAEPGRAQVIARGQYLVELLGCGACHTDGALIGEPNRDRALAGSRVGIAYTNPLANRYPGIVFPPNLTPDPRTGIGNWSARDIVASIRAGSGRHGRGSILVMPWPGYQKISDDDVAAIASYLQSLSPVEYTVPANVAPGERSREPFVHFGVYRPR